MLLLMLMAWLQFTTLGNSAIHTINQQGTPSYTVGDSPPVSVSTIAGTAPPVDKSTGSPVDKSAGNTDTEVEEEGDAILQYSVNDQLQGSLGELAIDSMGMFLYFGAAIIGCFVMLRRREPLRVTWVLLSIAALAIGFLPQLIGVSLIEHRWWYLAQVLLAIPLGAVLVRTTMRTKKWYGVAVVSVLVGVIAFLSTVGLPNNMTNRLFSPNLIARYALTEKEMEGKEIAESYDPKVLGADPYMMSYIHSDAFWHYPINQKALSAGNNIIHGDFANSPCDVILLRAALRTEPFAFGSGAIYKLEGDPVRAAEKAGYEVVFDNGEVQCLVRRK